jgi:hypothetical protein
MEGSDDTQTGATGDETGTTGPETGQQSSAPGGQQGDSGVSHTDTDTDTESVSDLKAKLTAANREAAKFRRERNEANSELSRLREAELSDTEKEKKRADEAEQRLSAQMERVQNANLRVALSTHGNIVDVDTAALLLRQQGVTFTEDGEPEQVDDAIKSLVEAKPWLVGSTGTRSSAGSTNAGAGNSDDGAGGVHLTADELAIARAFHMSPEDYAKNKDVHPATT